jgi:hypothetical protein
MPLAIAITAWCRGTSLEAQCPGCTEAVKKHLSYALTVTRTNQDPVLEFTPVPVRFTMTVSVTGSVGPVPTSQPVRVCAKVPRPETTCSRFGAPVPGRVYGGQVVAMASFAGGNSAIDLVVLGVPEGGEDYGGTPLAEGGVKTEVAARYEVAITGFEVVTSRSNKTDTPWLALQAMVSADPPHPSAGEDACHLAGFHWCQPPRRYGDAGDGAHAVGDVRVGPYDLVPERERDLRFLFYLDNIGDRHKEEIAAGVANGFSKAGMIILSAYSAAQGSTAGQSFATELDKVMEQMHSSATASCDGKLADDIVVLTNQTLANRAELTLDALTRASGAYSGTLPNEVDTYHNKDGDFICDRRGSQYRVTYTVFRTSWAPWAAGVTEW